MNVIKIFKDDIKRIIKNPIAIIVIIGVIILPSLYAWFNIIANWDPYSSTGGLAVAVVNNDKGYNLMGKEMSLGDNIVDTLKDNDKMGWKFVDEDEAIEGAKSGKYYAAIVIPEDFSKDITSVLSGDIVRPRIDYYCNSKKNAIAPKMTNSGVSTIQNQVNTTFVQTITKSIEDVIISTSESSDKYNVSSNIIERFDKVNSNMDTIKQSLNAFNDTVKAFNDLNNMMQASVNGVEAQIDIATNSLGNAKNTINSFTAIGIPAGDATDSSNDLQNSLSDIQAKLNEIQDILNNSSGTNIAIDRINQIMQNIKDQKDSLNNKINAVVNQSVASIKNNANTSVDGVISNLQGLKTNLTNVSDVLSKLGNALDSTQKAFDTTIGLIEDIQGKINDASEEIKGVAQNQNLKSLFDTLSNNTELISEFIAAPVEVDTKELYPIDNYGTAMTPFYTTLAIWVGGIVLVAILKTTIKSREQYTKLKPYQEYLGRYILFFILAFLQSTIICLGDIFYLKIQCDNRIAFLVACWMASFIFSTIIYTLTISFGDVGKALSVLLLVIQLAGAGGTFPIEVTPEFFQKINKFLPFTHSINAMRESIAGMYGMDYMKDLVYLLAFLPFVLILGLLLRNPLIHANEFFEEKLKNTELM